jgi:hypothetical protein
VEGEEERRRRWANQYQTRAKMFNVSIKVPQICSGLVLRMALQETSLQQQRLTGATCLKGFKGTCRFKGGSDGSLRDGHSPTALVAF